MRFADLRAYPHLASRERRTLDAAYGHWARTGEAISDEKLRFEAGLLGADIESIRRLGLIENRSHGWQPTVLGLVHLDHPDVERLLDHVDRLVRFGHDAYRPDLKSHGVAEVEAVTGLTRDDLAQLAAFDTSYGGVAVVARGNDAPVVETYPTARETRDLGDLLRSRHGHVFRPSHALRAPRSSRLLDLRVRRLEIERFRVLRSTRIDLPSDLTVLVGPNGAGKSTVLEAVEFVGQAVLNGLGAALERVRGIERLRTAGTTDPVSIALGFDADIGESARTPGEYGFELREHGGAVLVEHEWLETTTKRGTSRWLEARRAVIQSLRSDGAPAEPRYKSAGNLALAEAWDAERHWIVSSLQGELGCIVLVDRDPVWTNDDDDELLQPVRRRDPLTFKRAIAPITTATDRVRSLETTLCELLPRIASVSVADLTHQTPVLEFRERGVDRPLRFEELSAGQRQIVLLAAVHAWPSQPRFVLLEEPDSGVHPDAMHALRDLLRQMARHSTVLATTHSPAFVAMLDAEREVVALDRDGTDVTARPLAQALRSRRWLDSFGSPAEAFLRGAMEKRV